MLPFKRLEGTSNNKNVALEQHQFLRKLTIAIIPMAILLASISIYFCIKEVDHYFHPVAPIFRVGTTRDNLTRSLNQKTKLQSRSTEYTFGGRLGLSDLYDIAPVTINGTTPYLIVQRKLQMSIIYKSTWCDVPYRNNNTSVVQTRREMCVVHDEEKTFYTIWDGYNVFQFDFFTQLSPSYEEMQKNIIDFPAVLPDAYDGQEFVIANNGQAIYVDIQNTTDYIVEYLNRDHHHYAFSNISLALVRTSTVISYVIKDISYRFKISNHPSGKGVTVQSVEFPFLCLYQFPIIQQIDSQFSLSVTMCNSTDQKQRFYWTGTYLVSSLIPDPIQNPSLVEDDRNDIAPMAFVLRFFALMYGESVGMVEINDRVSSQLSLWLATPDNYFKNPIEFPSMRMSSDPSVESFYNSTSPWSIMPNDANLQLQLGMSKIPLLYSSASRMCMPICLFLLLALQILVH